MKSRPKLIILNGFSGSGKTTIAKRYIEDHPLAMNLEGDEIIAMLGGWKDNYDKARKCVFPHTKAMVKTHLELGYDVVVPYLLVNASEAEEFENIAKNTDARFFEVILSTDKEEAINGLMERGTWGEEGLPKLTKKDLPEIKNLYQKMEKATAKRPNTIALIVQRGNIDHTYEEFLSLIK